MKLDPAGKQISVEDTHQDAILPLEEGNIYLMAKELGHYFPRRIGLQLLSLIVGGVDRGDD